MSDIVDAAVTALNARLDGELDPTGAFMSGRLTVAGDMGLAMRLGTLLG